MRRVAILVLGVSACGEKLTGLPNQPGGNPLVPEVALFPFPSDLYREQGPRGPRLAFPPSALPAQLPHTLFSEIDGFSPIPLILTLVPGLDPASLPGPERTLALDSPVLLLSASDRRPVPLLVELDQLATDPAQQALILRPLVALAPAERHVVVLGAGLRLLDGQAPPAGDAFRALRDGIETDSPELEAQRGAQEEINELLEELGRDPAQVFLAWSFTTRAREPLWAPLLAMHDAMAAAALPPPVITNDRMDSNAEARIVEGTVELPCFLDDEGALQRDDAGRPVVVRTAPVPFVLTLPASIDAPRRPLITFGHGLFSDRYEPTRATGVRSLSRWKVSALSADFTGFDQPNRVGTAIVLAGAWDQYPRLIAQQMQAQASFTGLARLAREHLAESITQEVAGQTVKVIDPQRVHYLGISNGGTQGAPILAASPAYGRGVLVVPGSGWTHMVQRASDWNQVGAILRDRVPDPRDIQAALALVQLLFDPVDGMSWTSALVDRPAGRPPLELALHQAVGDCQVANLVTEWLARSAAVPLMQPAPKEIFGLAPYEGGRSALFVYDERYPPLPRGNTPPESDNGAHGSVRRLEAYLTQVGRFLEDGALAQVCAGACDPD